MNISDYASGRIEVQPEDVSEGLHGRFVVKPVVAAADVKAASGAIMLMNEAVELRWASLGSAENYVGYGGAAGFASPGGAVLDEHHVYSVPAELRRNQWALSGDWRIGLVPVLLNEPGGSISYQFHARDLHLVMGPPLGRPPVRFRVRLNGKRPGPAHGVDVEDGKGMADYQRIYHLVRQAGPIGDRVFQIEFSARGVEAYVFTFG